MYHYSIRPKGSDGHLLLPCAADPQGRSRFKKAGGVEKKPRVRCEGRKKNLVCSKIRLLLALFPPPTPRHPSPPPLQPCQRKSMPPISTASNPLPRSPPSAIIEPAQRSPVLSPRVADQRQQRSGSVRLPSPPPRASTPPQPSPDPRTGNGSPKPEVGRRRFFGPILLSSLWCTGPWIAHGFLLGYTAYRYGDLPTTLGLG